MLFRKSKFEVYMYKAGRSMSPVWLEWLYKDSSCRHSYRYRS